MVTAAGKMKKMNFRDQINLLTSWFKEWSECEQTVALYTLLKRVNASQARFLDLVLEQTLAESEEYIQLEREANNPGGFFLESNSSVRGFTIKWALRILTQYCTKTDFNL